MGISTITAGRIYAGQKRGQNGEAYTLAMDTLPHMALSKTYSHNFQVSDSAATATAMVAGVKVNGRTLGITKEANFSDCAAAKANGVDTLFQLAERSGLATGLVSTARLTHATPASAYAKSASRDWEAPSDMKEDGAADCSDIAAQFVDWPEGDGFEVALGGGRSNFTTTDQVDPEDENRTGKRTDGRDLTAEWTRKSNNHAYITDRQGFSAIDWASESRVLGLFEASHMDYELDRPEDITLEPSIAEMTRAAITRLSQDEDGYVLMVEGGRIDHGHHGVNAARALEDTDAFDQAVAAALEMTSAEDTLIIVTADHSHTLTIAGYPGRNNPILGKVTLPDGEYWKGLDEKPYTTLQYANGQSACRVENGKPDCARQDLTDVDTTDKDFQQPSRVPLYSETHGGEDVAIFARGPGSELVSGVMEQNEIFHVMGRASGLVE
ncbi:UNVERIFIED_CONTAM: hypothetical protein GTU68_026816 [Idotea baltica]|nr:hypothetical protein [Idotea baltica]